MTKLYSTPQAVAYLERHPGAVFEPPFGDTKITLSMRGSVLECCIGEAFIDISMDYGWHLVSPKPKRERVRLGNIEVNGVYVKDWPDGSDVASDLPDGTWTVYAVKAKR